MTDRRLVARLSREAGQEPRRRAVGAYRWTRRTVHALGSSRSHAEAGHQQATEEANVEMDELEVEA
jgi:hypothetical protein